MGCKGMADAIIPEIMISQTKTLLFIIWEYAEKEKCNDREKVLSCANC